MYKTNSRLVLSSFTVHHQIENCFYESFEKLLSHMMMGTQIVKKYHRMRHRLGINSLQFHFTINWTSLAVHVTAAWLVYVRGLKIFLFLVQHFFLIKLILYKADTQLKATVLLVLESLFCGLYKVTSNSLIIIF